MPSIISGGKSQALFIKELRDELRDYPYPIKETFTGNGTSTYMRCQRFPILEVGSDPGGTGSNGTFVTVGGVNQTFVDAIVDLAANQVFVDWDTGYFYFSAAPANASAIVFGKKKVRWSDATLLLKMQDALRVMFPKLGEIQQTTFQVVTNQSEYTLPSPDFQDQNTRILDVEIQEIPSTIEKYWSDRSWRQPTYNTLLLNNYMAYTPGANIRVTYWGPFKSLSDLPTNVQQLPKLYAKGMLMLDQEQRRVKLDTAQVSVEEDMNPAGVSAQLGQEFLAEFYRELGDSGGLNRMAPIQSTYGR